MNYVLAMIIHRLCVEFLRTSIIGSFSLENLDP